MASSRVRKPNAARYSRTSWATNSKKLTTYSALPVNLARNVGFWVATPTGQVSRWQTRIMMQPETTKGAVAKPYSSAPSRAAITTSRPVLSWPSVCTTIRSRSLLAISVCWVSASPSSHVVPGNQHHVGVRLGHPGGHRADPHLRHQLHVHPGPRIGVFQVVDQLLDVL